MTLGVLVLGFSYIQVRAGRWAHVDASVPNERISLNVFLVALCLFSAALLWFVTHRLSMSVALALSGAIVLAALLLARWLKLSLHAAFAAFATALLWPIKLAVVGGVLATAAVVWSRLALGRHSAAEVVAGGLVGIAAGAAYQMWAA